MLLKETLMKESIEQNINLAKLENARQMLARGYQTEDIYELIGLSMENTEPKKENRDSIIYK